MGFYCAIVNADNSFLDSLKNYFSSNNNNVFYNNDNNRNVISSIDWSKIFKSVSPAVVSIFTQTGVNNIPFNFGIGGFAFNNNQNRQEPISAGSGFCVRMQNNKLYVATNYHVIKDAKQIAVLFGNDRINNSNIVNAIVYRTDPNNDLAVLEIDLNDLERNTNIQRNQIQFIKWGNSNNSEVGNQVLAIGNTFGIGLSISNGIISSKKSNMFNTNNNITENCIQHTATINYGNSGGILVNTNGEVIGINTAMYSNNNCNNNFIIGFAIPSDIARSIIDSLIDNNNNNNSVLRGWIGIEIQSLSYDEAKNLGVLPNDPSIKPKSFGASITQVDYNSPADKAGIKPNDVVVAFNNKLIDENNPLQKLIGEYEIGKTATLFVLRRNNQTNKIEQFEINVTISNSNNYNYSNTNVININNREEIDDLGIAVENNSNQVVIVRGSGTILNNWWNNWGPMQLFQEGDIITQANGTDINNTKQLKDFVRDFYNRNPNDTITFSVTRQNGFNNKSFIRVTTARIRK